MKNKLLCINIFILFFSLIFISDVYAGGGSCSPSDNPSSPTSVSTGTTYSYSNSNCDATAACETPAIAYCPSCNCTFDECYYAVMGAVCFVTSCFCGSPENTNYARFCPATSGSYTFSVSNISCSGGGASLQWGIKNCSTGCNSGYNVYCTNGTTNNQNSVQTLTAGQCYCIFFDGNAGAACTWNFLITAPPPQPVTWLDLRAMPVGNQLAIEWSTASESNNDFFTIERSLDGFSFNGIGTVKGAGNSSTIKTYAFMDENPPKGFVYYRIKQTDFDGKYEYSPIVVANVSGNYEFEIAKIFPSVATDFVTISLNSDETRDVSVLIYDIGMNRQLAFGKQVAKGNNIFYTDVASLEKGIYYIIIQKGNERSVAKFLKL